MAVGTRNGLDHESVVNLDNVTTLPVALLGRRIGLLLEDQEHALTDAPSAAFDLEV